MSWRRKTALVCLLGLLPREAAAQVAISDATDEGIDCFKVETPTATYFFDKAGAGFTSLVDGDGNDWIGFHPEGTADNGQSGWFRGIPNMGLNQFGHPGYSGATSVTPDAKGVSLPSVTIRAEKDAWRVSWIFFATHAELIVESVGENYWFLYEGTPGGAVGADDTCHRSGGQSDPLDQAWEGDLSADGGVEWVFFADGTLERSLFMAHEDDAITDQYYLMAPMTVFGFGRQRANTDRLLDATPARLVLGLVESRDPTTVRQRIVEAFAGVAEDIDGGASGGDGPRVADLGQTSSDGGSGRPEPLDGGSGEKGEYAGSGLAGGCRLGGVPTGPIWWSALLVARRRRGGTKCPGTGADAGPGAGVGTG